MIRATTTLLDATERSSLLLPYHTDSLIIEEQEQRQSHHVVVPISTTVGSVKRNVLASKILTVMCSVSFIAWIGFSSLSSSSSSSSSSFYGGDHTSMQHSFFSSSLPDDGRNDDTILYRWEEFLHEQIIHVLPQLQSQQQQLDHPITDVEEEDEDVSRNMKSDTKKELHKQKKLDKKDIKMKAKTVSAIAKEKVHTVNAADDTSILASTLVYLNTSKAFRFIRHDVEDLSNDFFYYQGGWEVQMNQAYCAVATSAAVLNSYRDDGITLPQDAAYVPFPFATQRSLVQDMCVQLAVIDVDLVSKVGLGIKMVPGLLNCVLHPQGYEAVAYPMDPSIMTIDMMRDLLKKALLNDQSRVVVNYDRGGVGQGPYGHGHWSPIGAYNPNIDSFLVMDVAKYKYPPVFVPSIQLFNAVSTMDNCAAMMPTGGPIDWNSGQFDLIVRQLGCQPGYRGFVIIQPIE